MLERFEHRPMLTAAMVLLAVLVLLVVALAAMLQPAAPIGVGGRRSPGHPRNEHRRAWRHRRSVHRPPRRSGSGLSQR
jgi:hypothetical protein